MSVKYLLRTKIHPAGLVNFYQHVSYTSFTKLNANQEKRRQHQQITLNLLQVYNRPASEAKLSFYTSPKQRKNHQLGPQESTRIRTTNHKPLETNNNGLDPTD